MTAPIRVVVADDEPLARHRIRRLLRREADVTIAAECADGAGTIAAVLRESPDLLFLDVQMPELDGFGVMRALPPGKAPVTVFVTAYDRYAIRAFDAQALDYLLKPYTEARFRVAFARARAVLARAAVTPPQEWLERVLIREEGRVRIVPVDEIDYLEASRNHVRVHAGGAAYLLREPLGALEARLDPARFGRIHRSTLVNLSRVAELEPWFSGDYHVVLAGGTRLRLSRTHRHEFESRLVCRGDLSSRAGRGIQPA